MFTTVDQFAGAFTSLVEGTTKILDALTDDSLKQAVADDHRTLGRMAWHNVTTWPEMMKYTGLKVQSVAEDAPMPATVDEIKKAYKSVTDEVLAGAKSVWTDADMMIEDEMYGQKFKRGFSAYMAITHEIHHRGQMTVLMRQASLKVPGVFGPSKEEWTEYGMQAPEV